MAETVSQAPSIGWPRLECGVTEPLRRPATPIARLFQEAGSVGQGLQARHYSQRHTAYGRLGVCVAVCNDVNFPAINDSSYAETPAVQYSLRMRRSDAVSNNRYVVKTLALLIFQGLPNFRVCGIGAINLKIQLPNLIAGSSHLVESLPPKLHPSQHCQQRTLHSASYALPCHHAYADSTPERA